MDTTHKIFKSYPKNQAVIKETFPDGSVLFGCATLCHDKADGNIRHWSIAGPEEARCEGYPEDMQRLVEKLNAARTT